MDLKLVEKMAIELIKEWLPKYDLMFDNAKRRFGLHIGCRKIITLSKPLCLVNDWDVIKVTVLHEIAHWIDYQIRWYSNHDRTWQKICISIGWDWERYYTERKWLNRVEGKHKYVCIKCWRVVHTHRKFKREKSCWLCYNTFNRNALLKKVE